MAKTSWKVTANRTSIKKFTTEERKLRQEASRLSSLANKRLKRMEEQNLTDAPAYRKWVEDGKAKFGVRGKSMAQVQAEIGRLNEFINQATSTVRGAKNYYKNIGASVGIVEWKDIPDLQNKLNNFFEITGKVKEYLHNSKEIGVAIGYQKIWEVVSEYVQEVDNEVKDTEQAVMEVAEKVVAAAGHGEMHNQLNDFLDMLEDRFR